MHQFGAAAASARAFLDRTRAKAAGGNVDAAAYTAHRAVAVALPTALVATRSAWRIMGADPAMSPGWLRAASVNLHLASAALTAAAAAVAAAVVTNSAREQRHHPAL